MNLTRLGRALSKGAVLSRDLNAVKRGRVPQRVVNRATGKIAGRLLRSLWR